MQNQEKFEKLYTTLANIIDLGRFSPAMIKILVDNVESIAAWVESKEFKENYANHPYPPLLNPKNANYKEIPAQYAWELNLPLPPLDMVFLRSHACGATGLSAFLEKCGGVKIYCGNFYGLDALGVYVDVYQKILKARESILTGGGVNLYIY